MQGKPQKEHIIAVNGISKTFPGGVRALIDFSTKVRRGEVLVVIGPSGSGMFFGC
jgi:ABC-type Fe3+/spermidine/putrescine transport system ATPase subunit